MSDGWKETLVELDAEWKMELRSVRPLWFSIFPYEVGDDPSLWDTRSSVIQFTIVPVSQTSLVAQFIDQFMKEDREQDSLYKPSLRAWIPTEARRFVATYARLVLFYGVQAEDER